MSTFAHVKHFTNANVFSLLILIVVTTLVATATVSAQPQATAGDSVEVSLLTCAPGQRLYSLYGHTAIRYHDKRTGDDWTFNYGVFDVTKKYFAIRFLFGLTDYELGVLPMDVFMDEYEYYGREVTEQVLNMTTEEKLALRRALAKNYQPENRVYRYNFFYDNCTTRARDIIEGALGGKIEYSEPWLAEKDGDSYRTLIRQLTALHPWAGFGDDLCLGLKADFKTDWRERQFLPLHLMADFDKAYVNRGDHKEPLVLKKRTVVGGKAQVVESEFPLSPSSCGALLLAATLLVGMVERKAKRWLRWYDALLMLAQGVVGIVITALLFSQHPTTSTNLQALLFNPIPLIFIYSVLRGRHTLWWRISFVLTLLFFAGVAFQHYAAGIVYVALALLLRAIYNERRQ